jgi:hypothetical protein
MMLMPPRSVWSALLGIDEQLVRTPLLDPRLPSLSTKNCHPSRLAAGAFSNPHEGHGLLNAVPHSLQNFRPSGFSLLQGAQMI